MKTDAALPNGRQLLSVQILADNGEGHIASTVEHLHVELLP
jgi:hypothetical protein